MRAAVIRRPATSVHYPDSDGQPMAENTLQFRWIVTLKENLDALLPDFVAGDLLWYPVEGEPRVRQAPDVLVALGRPKGERGSYMQWEEGGVAPQVVFEVLSPGNTLPEMVRKRQFYERYGVSELYIYDPDRVSLQLWWRVGGRLEEQVGPGPWRSPLLGVDFDLGEELEVRGPDGQLFRSFQEESRRAAEAEERAELSQRREALERARAERERERAEQERQQKELERARAEQERARAEQERQQKELEQERAEQERARAEQERQQKEQERERADAAERRAKEMQERMEALAARLAALGLEA